MQTTAVSLDEIEKRFAAASEAETLGWFAEQLGHIRDRAERKHEPTEIHLATGTIRLDSLTPKSPWVLVIDGDLEVSAREISGSAAAPAASCRSHWC